MLYLLYLIGHISKMEPQEGVGKSGAVTEERPRAYTWISLPSNLMILMWDGSASLWKFNTETKSHVFS